MNFVIPMAGRGQRFRDAGYSTPKWQLRACGKSLLEWSVDSLPLEICERLIFVLLREHLENYQAEQFIRERYGCKADIRIVVLEEVTRGQSETVLRARSEFDPDRPLVIFNIDTQFYSKSLAGLLKLPNIDGVLGAFRSRDPRFSFALVQDGFVVKTAEKEPISDFALTGLYSFRDPSSFIVAAEEQIHTNNSVRGEFYVAPLYNKMLAQGARIVIDEVEECNILGTPEEYAAFMQRGHRVPPMIS